MSADPVVRSYASMDYKGALITNAGGSFLETENDVLITLRVLGLYIIHACAV